MIAASTTATEFVDEIREESIATLQHTQHHQRFVANVGMDLRATHISEKPARTNFIGHFARTLEYQSVRHENRRQIVSIEVGYTEMLGTIAAL